MRDIIVSLLIVVTWIPTLAMAQEEAESVTPPPDVEKVMDDVSSQPTFLDQLQQYYESAKESGSTTASSAAHWLAERYDDSRRSAMRAAGNSVDWVTGLYNEAVESGETTAKTATDWVVDDISRFGTWQYKVIWTSPQDLEATLNALGDERWEAFSVVAEGEQCMVSLKRPHRSYLRQLPARDLLRLLPLLHGDGDSNE